MAASAGDSKAEAVVTNGIGNVDSSGDEEEEVSLGQISDEDDEVTAGSITAAALAALSLHDSQRPGSAAAARPGSGAGGAIRRKRTCSTSATISTEREPIIRTSRRTIYTAGRPPWYNKEGQLIGTFVIGICGGSASGKTTVAKKIIKSLNIDWVTLLSMDSFYKVLSEEQHEAAARNEYNFDHPDAFDFALLVKTLKRLKSGKRVEVPIYNFVTHRREPKTSSMYGKRIRTKNVNSNFTTFFDSGANVLIFEGILAFHDKDVLDLLDMKIFVDTDPDIRLSRRLKRDITARGRDIKGVLEQYNRHVKPAFDYYIAPTMTHADIIVPRGGENEVAINLIVHHVKNQLNIRGFKFRDKLANHFVEGQPLPDTLKVLPTTPQVKKSLKFAYHAIN